MEYGQSAHYLAGDGAKYFAYQNAIGELGGALNLFKFAKHIQKTDRVVDFGCGGGWLLKKIDCADKVGVEPNPAARAQCAENGIRAVATLAEVVDKADVVISNHCLEHVPYPIEALREVRGVLKAGGKLVLVVPIDDWRVEKSYHPDDINHHLHTWTPLLLGNTLVEAGFSVETLAVLTDAWPPRVAQLRRALPAPLFRAACWAWAVLRRRRQLVAVAVVA
jgi:SAM-dependent methyltransferase